MRSPLSFGSFASAILAATLVVSASSVASAQNAQNAEGFSLNRFDPSERGSDFFALDSLDLRGDFRPFAGAVIDWAYKPLVLYNADGSEQKAIVEHQAYFNLGGGVILFDKLRIGLNLPLALSTGESGSVDTITYRAPNGRPLGDLRLAGEYRLFGQYGDPLTIAGGLNFYIPTGDSENYTGDDTPRGEPHATLAGRFALLQYSARLGLMIRGNAGTGYEDATGTELRFGVGVGVRLLQDRLVIGPELYGSSVLSDDIFSRRATPFEVLVGGHMALPKPLPEGFRAGLAVGPGLTHGAGTPVVRVIGSIEWMPAIERKPLPSDRDADGQLDPVDACPDVPGVPSPDPARNGCPPPTPEDRDGDGIIDEKDACPTEPGPANQDPKKNGCPPPPDRDRDTFIDPEDACPDEPGLKSEDPKKNGCPPPKDTDADTIVDPEDACPEQAGPPNQDPKKHGCPVAVIDKGQIKILEQVKFKTGKADILPESEPILQAVLKILNEHPEILKIRVEGHTDNTGNRGLNKTLSTARAASVAKWLTSHGIDKKRMTSQGFGQEKPIAPNDTEEGRRDNRRVEFHIAEEKKAQ
jgi:OOP family OmpA-OmpF porin